MGINRQAVFTLAVALKPESISIIECVCVCVCLCVCVRPPPSLHFPSSGAVQDPPECDTASEKFTVRISLVFLE